MSCLHIFQLAFTHFTHYEKSKNPKNLKNTHLNPSKIRRNLETPCQKGFFDDFKLIFNAQNSIKSNIKKRNQL